MGRELQKKKNKSGLHKVRRKPKKTQKPLLANHIIAEHWDRSQTITQNYKRLGLTSKLNSATGGTERQHLSGLTDDELRNTNADRLAINNAGPKQFKVQEARIERDPKTGAILRIMNDGASVHQKKTAQAPYKALEDPLEALDAMVRLAGDEHDRDGQATEDSIIKTLEEQASRPSAPKRRKQSDREKLFIEQLIREHGTDEAEGCYEKMARDHRINVMQQSAGDLRKRVRKYLKTQVASEDGWK